MLTSKPTNNPISSWKEFKTVCVTGGKSCNIRLDHQAIRHLRLTSNTAVASVSLLPESIHDVYSTLADRKQRLVRLEDVHE
ncbi:hypothetical protein PI125_g21905 [Phytophthora idaei]|nr:hypothetical protein PI125_g21905 [Phytophthora idaei]